MNHLGPAFPAGLFLVFESN